MSERSDERVRDLGDGGDVGADSHSAFAASRDGVPTRNDERLGERGRSTARDESAFVDELDEDRASRAHGGETGEAER